MASEPSDWRDHMEQVNAACACCTRCLGRGIVGHMGIGHDPCPECGGLGVRRGHDVNLYLVAVALRDKLVDAAMERASIKDAVREEGRRAGIAEVMAPGELNSIHKLRAQANALAALLREARVAVEQDNWGVAVDWRGRLQCDLVAAFYAGPIHGDVAVALSRCRRIHLAIMREPWASYVADGSKVVESRWGKVRCAPHDDIDPGDVIAWKRTGGDVYGVSCVASARTTLLRDDAHVAEMVDRHHAAIRIPNDPARYAGKRLLTLILLGRFVPLPTPIPCRQPGRAGWIVVHDRGALRG